MSIGTPIPNYRIYIVAPGTTDLLPPGFIGELMIGGEGVSTLGYVGEPDKTTAKFVKDPFVPTVDAVDADGAVGASMNSSLMYHSGDLARFSPHSGSLEFRGRMDAQVKIRGYRVELSEIESVMLEVGGDAIESAVVDVRGDKLIGFVLLRKDQDWDEMDADPIQTCLTELREKMTTLLASYMVPAVIYAVDDIPKLTSGKVVRSQLKVPNAESSNENVTLETKNIDDTVEVVAELEGDQEKGEKEGKEVIEEKVEYTKEQKMIVNVFEQQLGLGTGTCSKIDK